MRTLATVLLALGVTAATASAGGIMESLMPEIRTLPRPTWVKPGARIIWWAASNSTAMVTDQNGRRVPKSTAGAGFSELTVVAVEGKNVAITVRSYFSQNGTEAEAPSIAGTVGAIVPGGGGDFWVHPKALAALMTRKPTPGVQVGRAQKDVNGKKVNIVMISMKNMFWQFDETSGVLMGHHEKTVPTQQLPVKGGSITEFRGFEQVTYPWMKTTMPAWTQKIKTYRYNGTNKMFSPGMPPFAQPLSLTHTRVGGGTTWFMTKVEAKLTTQAAVPPNPVLSVSGLGVLGICLPPKELVKLRVGTVLARNKWAQSETTVVHVGANQGRQVVILRESAPQFVNEFHYDTQSGALIFSKFLNRTMNMETSFTLQGTE